MGARMTRADNRHECEVIVSALAVSIWLFGILPDVVRAIWEAFQ